MTSNQEALNTLNNYFEQENDDDIHETSKTLHQNYHQIIKENMLSSEGGCSNFQRFNFK